MGVVGVVGVGAGTGTGAVVANAVAGEAIRTVLSVAGVGDAIGAVFLGVMGSGDGTNVV